MKKNAVYKILYIIVVVVIALGLAYIALKGTMPDLIPLIESGNAEDITQYLAESSTAKGVICTVLLQMVQVWSLFLSGMPIQVAAGCVFGFFKAFVICHLASVAAQFIAIVVWRKMGQALEKWIPVGIGGKGKFNEFLNSKAPPAYIVILACMIPLVTNGLIPLFASKMDISIKKYTFSVWLGSITNVLLCCAVGHRLVRGDWVISCILLLIQCALFLLLWFFRDKILSLYNKLRPGGVK